MGSHRGIHGTVTMPALTIYKVKWTNHRDMHSFHFTCSQFNRGYKLHACSWDDLAISKKSTWSDFLGWQDCRTSDMACYRHSERVSSVQILRRIFKLPQWSASAQGFSVRSLKHYGFISKMCIKSAPACQIHVQIGFLYRHLWRILPDNNHHESCATFNFKRGQYKMTFVLITE